MKKIIIYIFLAAGIIFFVINIIGFFIPLKNPDIYYEKTGFSNDIILSYNETINILESIPQEDTKKYVEIVNKTFNDGLAQYWDDAGLKKYNITVPIYENYILFALAHILPSKYATLFKKYEYWNYKKALERGIGLCSQHTIAIADFLNKKRIETQIVGLGGHVVATAKVDKEKNEWWVLDPDFGIIIPYSIKEIESSPNIVKKYYTDKGAIVETIIAIYEKTGNSICPLGIKGNLSKLGFSGYCGWKQIIQIFIEDTSYLFKWIIPIFLVMPFFIFYIKNIMKKNNAQ